MARPAWALLLEALAVPASTVPAGGVAVIVGQGVRVPVWDGVGVMVGVADGVSTGVAALFFLKVTYHEQRPASCVLRVHRSLATSELALTTSAPKFPFVK